MIEKYIPKINKAINDLFAHADRRYGLGRISGELLKRSRDFVLRPGKRIRPLLMILAYKGYTRRASFPEQKLLTAAVSIELLHDYMLIHDDVIDNSLLRRGKPTLHKMFEKNISSADGARIGEALAIVAGDIIFALAVGTLTAIEEDPRRKEAALKKLVEAAVCTGAGEFIDVVFGPRAIDRISERDIFLTYTLKTAKYTFECPLSMGALLAGAPSKELKKLSSLGLAAGQAFQIYDDFLDLFATQKLIGKPVLTDLSESKKTLLVYRTYRRLKGAARAAFRRILEKEHRTAADLELFKAQILASGAYDACLREMTSLQKKALALCRGLSMKKEFRDQISDIITKLSPTKMPVTLQDAGGPVKPRC